MQKAEEERKKAEEEAKKKAETQTEVSRWFTDVELWVLMGGEGVANPSASAHVRCQCLTSVPRGKGCMGARPPTKSTFLLNRYCFS